MFQIILTKLDNFFSYSNPDKVHHQPDRARQVHREQAAMLWRDLKRRSRGVAVGPATRGRDWLRSDWRDRRRRPTGHCGQVRPCPKGRRCQRRMTLWFELAPAVAERGDFQNWCRPARGGRSTVSWRPCDDGSPLPWNQSFWLAWNEFEM